MTSTLEIEINRNQNYVVISLCGEVDLYSSPKFRKQLIPLTQAKLPTIVIDLSKVSYMDSSGVATLVEGLQLIEKYKGNFYITGLTPMVREVFELSRLDSVFSIHESVEQLQRNQLIP
ncbi:MAG TPA: anti-sigma factor antagonist [Bacteroidetes bacterium]|nr:anti-sigma factor antagonist [Bacteroidota bacterium]